MNNPEDTCGFHRVAWQCACVLACFLTAGCRFAPPMAGTEYEYPLAAPTNFFVSPYFYQMRPRRVVIMTPPNRSSLFLDQTSFAESLAIQLRNAGVTDAVLGGTDGTCNLNAIRQGQFDEYQLVQLSQLYNADAVLYCDIVSVSPYSPLNASISMAMVDARESILLMAIDGMWDLRNTNVAWAFKKYTCRGTRQDNFNSELHYQSPTEFLAFIAYELSQYLRTVE